MSQVIKQTNHEFIQHDISNFHKIASYRSKLYLSD